MGRAPQPGGPQRVSAHVVPKAKPYPEDDEEKTTIESPWEEDGSTTVEQGEVAEKIRALGVEPPRRTNTNVTSTGAGLEEPTVDDQHVNPAIVAITPPSMSRLMITQGKDAGQELSIAPGKSYTIGRAVDNDFVLSDIAVSRKHFDLRHEDGAWVIVDRGSGNGTVVNGNVEDHPFVLANGDQIEIGNTVFRFEHANGHAAARPASVHVEIDLEPPRELLDSQDVSADDDDDELSTVAGKPMRQELIDAATPIQAPLREMPRAKTLPPPMPSRSRPMTAPPALQFVPDPLVQPASTLPLPQMANRPPMLAPQAPTLLGVDAIKAMHGGHAHASHPGLANHSGVLPTTIPGQGMQHMPPAGYPQLDRSNHMHAQMLHLHQQARPDPTAHVAPMSYASAQPQRFASPQLSRRTRFILLAGGLGVLAAMITIAIIKSGSGDKPQVAAGSNATGSNDKTAASGSNRGSLRVEAIETPTPTTKVEPKPEPKLARTDPKLPEPKPPEPKLDPKLARTDPKPDPKPDPKVTRPEPKPPEPKPPEPKPDPKLVRNDPKPPEPKPDPKPDPEPRIEAKSQPKPPKRGPTPTTVSKRVATASEGADSHKADEARKSADALFQAKRFTDASNLLASAAKSTPDDEAKKLRHRADQYALFGRAYALGTAPASRPTEAFDNLRSALGLDSSLGNVFNSDLEGRLQKVAPRAAVGFMTQHAYDKALAAVITAESLGVSDETTQAVRRTLDSEAGKLITDANNSASTDPAAAKDKLRKVLNMIDQKSQNYARAKKALQALNN
jgi:hypothetical protein